MGVHFANRHCIWKLLVSFTAQFYLCISDFHVGVFYVKLNFSMWDKI